MSVNSLRSEWVATEIRIAYQRELDLGRTVLIPVLLGDCSIPPELGVKKYVDARVGAKGPASSYRLNLSELKPAIQPAARVPENADPNGADPDVTRCSGS